ncbi:major latex protein 149 [Cucumis sativus]|uniref:major latex protein 149 n=1 Tax=Cucumis sativus TaxID=3659 RepID=UPI0012F4F1BB|nr:major latex protein 149 [Cucumis sativus]KAE8650619.1 hypothetical protein Csa_011700 [Cucumis sativus]
MDMKNEQDLKLNFKMAQIAKISEQVQLKCSGHKFYDFFTNKMDSVIQMFPHIVTSYKILEGNGFAHGSVIHLKYNIGGPAEIKERLAFDDANKSIAFEVFEGDLFRDFEVFKMKMQVINEKGSNGSSVNWSIEFVKENEDVAAPHHYLTIAAQSSKTLDDYLCNN